MHEVSGDDADQCVLINPTGGLAALLRPDGAAVILRGDTLPGLEGWLQALDPARLPRAREILRPEAVRTAARKACEAAQTPEGAERERLIDDISALARSFSDHMRAPWLRLRLDVVTTNACRRFHIDAVTARLVCTYRGTGTQYCLSTAGAERDEVFTVPTGAPIVLRGSRWPGEDHRPSVLHRSPPIEGTGETRLVLVLDPVSDPDEDG